MTPWLSRLEFPSFLLPLGTLTHRHDNFSSLSLSSTIVTQDQDLQTSWWYCMSITLPCDSFIGFLPPNYPSIFRLLIMQSDLHQTTMTSPIPSCLTIHLPAWFAPTSGLSVDKENTPLIFCSPPFGMYFECSNLIQVEWDADVGTSRFVMKGSDKNIIVFISTDSQCTGLATIGWKWSVRGIQ